MKRSDYPKRNKPWWLLLVLLAVLCITGTELVACAFFAPETFARITAPVRSAAAFVAETGASVADSVTDGVSGWIERLNAKPEPPELPEPAELPAVQEAGAPVVENAAPILDPAITELVFDGDTAILTGGIVPVVYFNQGEAPWAEAPYGSDNIGKYGCGPTVMAMAIRSLTGTPIDPAQMAEDAVATGHWACQQGSYLSIVNALAARYELAAAPLEEKTPDAMLNALLSGKLLVALMGPGHFTNGGHFILIRGVTLQGTFLIADPNSTEHSLQEWDAQVILDELSASTHDGAPLWTLSLP